MEVKFLFPTPSPSNVSRGRQSVRVRERRWVYQSLRWKPSGPHLTDESINYPDYQGLSKKQVEASVRVRESVSRRFVRGRGENLSVREAWIDGQPESITSPGSPFPSHCPALLNVVLVFTNANVAVFNFLNTFPAPHFGLRRPDPKSYWKCWWELPLPNSRPEWYLPVLCNGKLF